jgi:3-methyl-2-oxobutanoate hydroxymethyltransferase
MKESGGHAVKLEGGKKLKNLLKNIKRVSGNGSLGLTPQSIYNLEPIPFGPKKRKKQIN